MRNLKKFLALVLAMMMALSLMVTVNAANVETPVTDVDQVTDEFQEAVQVLNGMGVITGYEDGTFRPDKEVRRTEAAALVYRLVTGDWNSKSDKIYSTYVKFTDVTSSHEWAKGYIGYCANQEIIKGVGGDRYAPDSSVTGYQMLAMVLRAMGYGQNKEFEGTGWQTRVASTATQLGMLKQINNTNYAGTLSAPASRELVAEILFQAAQLPMVRYELGYYNPYVGVASGTGDNILNKSLGELNYGLAKYTGAVVGNEATGEDYTLLSMNASAVYTGSTPALTDVKINDGTLSYVHGTTNKAYNAGDFDLGVSAANPNGGTVTLAFDIDTGLDLFGHKATVWYDNRTSGGDVKFGDNTNTVDVPSAYSKTYAILDKATLVKTVFATDKHTAVKATVATNTSIYTAMVSAGFHKDSAPTLESQIFAQFTAVSNATTPASAEVTAASKVGMYTVISNNDGKTADVVIALNQEVAEITQRNTTVKDGEYIYLGYGDSTFGDELVASSSKLGLILDEQLSATSDKTLGDIVTVNQVVGTAYGVATCDIYGTKPGGTPYLSSTGTAITTAPTDPKEMMYDTKELEPSFTGVISTYKVGATDIKGKKWIATQSTNEEKIVTNVTLSDGTKLVLSGITGSQFEYGFDATPDSHLNSGVTALTSLNVAAGMSYNFYTDAVGNFVGVRSSSGYEFLYATFADYEVGALGTGTIGYYVYGVDWDGNIVKTNNQITSVVMPYDSGDFDESGTKTTFPNTTDPLSLAEGYNALPITLKDQGSAVVGNQIKAGVNTRFMLNGEGKLTWYSEGGKYGNRFVHFWDTSLVTPAVSSTWHITAKDAQNGFVRVYNDPSTTAPTDDTNNVDYLLTNNTKFIVVTGSGTADLSVRTYTGLTDLLNGGSSADIVYDSANEGDNVYFITGEQRYGNVDTSKNRTIDTVILSDTNLKQYGAQNLFFSAPGSTATGVTLASNPADVYQYKLWNNGVEDTYFVKGGGDDDSLYTGYDADEPAKGDTNGNFYTLVQIDTIDGAPIYKAMMVTDDSESNAVNKTYQYIVVNNVNTAEIGGDVYKVGNAVVAEAYGTNTPAIETNGIDTVEKLNHAVSMGSSGASGDLYTVTVAIVYDDINVSCIYVTNITTT